MSVRPEPLAASALFSPALAPALCLGVGRKVYKIRSACGDPGGERERVLGLCRCARVLVVGLGDSEPCLRESVAGFAEHRPRFALRLEGAHERCAARGVGVDLS